MDPTLDEINKKLDLLTTQVTYLSEQASMAERARESRDDLLDAAAPVMCEAMRLASNELEEVQAFVRLPDLLRMLKKLIVHGPQLEQLLDQLDSISDLMDTTGPVVKLGMDTVTNILDEMERKGYFMFGKEAVRITDTVVSSFTKAELEQLEESLPSVLDTVKAIAKPETTKLLKDTVTEVELEIKKPVNKSLGALLRQMRDPDVIRGLAITLRLLKVIGKQAALSE